MRSSYHLLFKNVSHHGSFQSVSKCLILLPTNHKRVWQTVFVYLCICVFVCVYLDVRHLGKLFLRSSYHLLFKNISHHGSFQGFHGRELCGANKTVVAILRYCWNNVVHCSVGGWGFSQKCDNIYNNSPLYLHSTLKANYSTCQKVRDI